jgi:citrate synthase
MSDSITITDNRTGESYEVPIVYGTYPKGGAAISAMALRQIKVSDDDFGLITYDPGFANTASTKSSITYIDGGAGILRYRGYSIEELATQSSFLEVAYLLMNGELPSADELAGWTHEIIHHTIVPHTGTARAFRTRIRITI